VHAGPQGGEQGLHRADADGGAVGVYEDLVPVLVVADVALAAEVFYVHDRVDHALTLHRPTAAYEVEQ
jgi:hypothetical protein